MTWTLRPTGGSSAERALFAPSARLTFRSSIGGIELIQPLDNQASVFRDRFPDGWPEEGLHHLGMIASDYDRFVQAHVDQGRAVVMSGIFSGYRFCYIDTRDTLGFMLEAFEKTASLLSFFGEIRSMGEEWDGKSAYA